ncbi:NAD-dependent succinate-semialdehyde dehydrogenase [Acanthopleuribacter pedis]|uniref:NAD-dependent succinate-semialdehyde dehydrogenase n=1 Tax=Acanthopleuribacter pedis TaxID=442870 RepID=A0A8J7Q5K8_9BACT|nr:NAD-dependent succinate-semialdehyde dehydrogenase [Acanthopleuribacter pedis]MBO1319515.1 NAD-dependent succinate-semialdehyde dehydrogenase [Acanthopleuribacter pedis]
MAFTSVNPATDEQLAVYPTINRDQALAVLDRLDHAQQKWCNASFEKRSRCLLELAKQLRDNAEEGARLMALEMGKPLHEGRSEMEKCAWVCEYFAEKGTKFLAPQPFPTEAANSFVAFEPLGVILSIMPWNFPFWQVFRFAAPALMAGNTVMLKHAPNVTGCAQLMTRLVKDAGFPPDLFELLVAELDVVSDIIAQPQIKAVTLTGSTRAGRAVAETAGRHLKKVVLELGGSDPYLILADADLDLAANACVTSRLINSGQSCIAAKRFIVVAPIAAAFTQKVLELMNNKTFGDPMAGRFDIGPMARKDLRDELHHQVEESVAVGAKRLLGGTLPPGPGCYYPPTLLGDVPLNAPAFREELFGPVASIITAKDEADAIALANQSPYGLGAAVFTADRARGREIATKQLNVGACFVNSFVRSDPRLPFGGVKDSGYGRELSIFGIREFVNVKTIWID